MLAKYHLCQLRIESDEADKITSICQLSKEDWKDENIQISAIIFLMDFLNILSQFFESQFGLFRSFFKIQERVTMKC